MRVEHCALLGGPGLRRFAFQEPRPILAQLSRALFILHRFARADERFVQARAIVCGERNLRIGERFARRLFQRFE